MPAPANREVAFSAPYRPAARLVDGSTALMDPVRAVIRGGSLETDDGRPVELLTDTVWDVRWQDPNRGTEKRSFLLEAGDGPFDIATAIPPAETPAEVAAWQAAVAEVEAAATRAEEAASVAAAAGVTVTVTSPGVVTLTGAVAVDPTNPGIVLIGA